MLTALPPPPTHAAPSVSPRALQVYVPEFNSIAAFRVPRWHIVTPVACDEPRYSVFGWFLSPGRLYELQLGSGGGVSGSGGSANKQRRGKRQRQEEGGEDEVAAAVARKQPRKKGEKQQLQRRDGPHVGKASKHGKRRHGKSPAA